MTRQYPRTRLRRLRQASWLRSLVSENRLTVDDLILPIFVHGGDDIQAIDTLPGVFRWPLSQLPTICAQASDAGIKCVALFPCIESRHKDPEGRFSTHRDNILFSAIDTVKRLPLDLGVIADVALDPYTSHGHDGVLNRQGVVDNDRTVAKLCELAVLLCRAGADIIAPSDMQDGRIGSIRLACDQAGYTNQVILSYAVKFCSSFYGPFRDAVGSNQALNSASKSTYQQDPSNQFESAHEVALDLEEGADIVMVKPGMPYQDILYQIASEFKVPTFVYQVSGEYQMFFPNEEALDDANRIAMLMETLVSFKRSGAHAIVSYASLIAANQLR
tara:strand:+ start:1131 stop:2123 length:993 start_codon:yes stop_codon:yes gene_type:complete